MDQLEARKLWIDALRSGEYTQTKSVLHDLTDGGYCCLGVACDVYQKHVGGLTIEDKETVTGNGWFIPIANRNIRHYDGEGAYLPQKVAEWLNISRTGVYTMPAPENATPNRMTNDLAYCNDMLNYNFEKIAEVIETAELHKYSIPITPIKLDDAI